MAMDTVTTIRDKGFGFIARDGSAVHGVLFVHRSAGQSHDFARLQPGDRVRFDEAPDPRDSSRHRTVNVQRADARTGEKVSRP